MPVTQSRGRQIRDDDVGREDINVTTAGRALIRKIIAGTNMGIASTGVDAGTGDVTINLSGTVAVANGGTGATSLTGVLIGNGTSAVSAVVGTAGQLLRRNAGNTAYEFFTHDFVSITAATTNTIPKWTSGTALGLSNISDNGSLVTIASNSYITGNLTLGQAASALQSGGTGITIYGPSFSEIKLLNSTTGQTATDGSAILISGLNLTINNRENGTLGLWTNNIERVTVAAAGAVGINTQPQTMLDVRRLEVVNRTTYTDILTIDAAANTNPYNGHGGGILFKGTTYTSSAGTSRAWGRIGMVLTDSSMSSTGENMFFEVAASNSSDTLTRAMTIRYDGNIGMGITNPINSLHISKATGQSGVQITNGTYGATITDGVFVGIDNSNAYLWNYENIPLLFATNNIQRLSISAAGLSTFTGGLVTSDTTASTSTTTGALRSAGGLGVAGAGYFGGNVVAPNFQDSTGAYNVNLGGTNGRGIAAGYSGASYGGLGYNIRHTATASTWIAPSTDTVSYLMLNNGLSVMYAPAGTAGRTITTELATIFRVEGTNGNISASGTATATSFIGAGNQLTSLPANTALYPILNQNTTGSAASLTTARTINDVAFNGTQDIIVPSLFNSNYTRFTNPIGGEYTTATATVTGAIAITLPVNMNGAMVRFTVKIYEYTTNESFELVVAGYPYGIGNTWAYSPSAYIIGNPSVDRRFTVRFGYNSTLDRGVIYIGELASTWSYPQIFITDIQRGYSGGTSAWRTGWSIGFEATAFQNVTATITNSQVGYQATGNVNNSVVLRDGSGNFSAGTITATLNGTASNATTWNGQSYFNGGVSQANINLAMVWDTVNSRFAQATLSQIQTWLGLGSNAYTSTSFLPLAGGTLTGTLNGTAISMSGAITGASLNISTSSNAFGDFNTTNSTGAYFTFRTNGVVYADIGSATQVFGSGGSDVFAINGRGARAITFGTNNTQRFTILANGDATFTNSVTAGNGFVSNRTGDSLSGQFYRSTINGTTVTNNGIILGKINTANNSGTLVYTHASDGSTNNRIGLGFWGNDNILNVRADGYVGIGTIAPDYQLHVVGNGFVTNAMYVGTDVFITSNAGYGILSSNGTRAIAITDTLLTFNRVSGFKSNITAWNPTTPGTTSGGIHLGNTSATANAGMAITFGARDNGDGSSAQAGIYTTTDGGYGTRMYLATTDNYSIGSKTAIAILQNGDVEIVRGVLKVKEGVTGTVGSTDSGVFDGGTLKVLNGHELGVLGSSSGNSGDVATLIFKSNKGNSTNGGYVEMQAYYAGGTYSTPIVMQRQGGPVLVGTATNDGVNRVQIAGTIKATKFTESSDRRIKTPITENILVGGVENIKAHLYLKDGLQEIGYYAQDVLPYIPSAVTKGADDVYTLEYRSVFAAKIASLENRVKLLEEELSKYKN